LVFPGDYNEKGGRDNSGFMSEVEIVENQGD
jgi:hypothetical protein